MKHNYTQGFESPEAFIPFLVIRRHAVGRLSGHFKFGHPIFIIFERKTLHAKEMTSRIQNNVILPPRINA